MFHQPTVSTSGSQLSVSTSSSDNITTKRSSELTTTINDEDLLLLIKTLKDIYIAQDGQELLIEEGKFKLNQLTIDLQLVLNINKEENRSNIPRVAYQESIEAESAAQSRRPELLDPISHESRQPISLENIFDFFNSDNPIPDYVIVQGTAGIGKTTLCQMLIYYWADYNSAQGNYLRQQFDIMLYFPLRQLVHDFPSNTKNQDYSIEEILLGAWDRRRISQAIYFASAEIKIV
jgi:hypothetical protein